MSQTPAEKVRSDICRERLRVLSSDLTVASWADRYRVLSSESAALYGKWSTLPFQRGPLEAVSDRKVHRVVVKSATQMLKTETILNGIGFFAHMDPGPILVLQPRDADAKAFSKERIAPMIRDTPCLQGKIKDARARDSGNTLLHKTFPGGHITIAGANSPAGLASRPIRVVFPRPLVWVMWVLMELVAMATDLAEFLGAAIGFNLLFGIPLWAAGLLTAVATFMILSLQVPGFRSLEALITAINSELTEDQPHVVILRFIEDFSLRETADIIGKEVNNVKVIQNRGIARLRKALGLQLDDGW